MLVHVSVLKGLMHVCVIEVWNCELQMSHGFQQLKKILALITFCCSRQQKELRCFLSFCSPLSQLVSAICLKISQSFSPSFLCLLLDPLQLQSSYSFTTFPCVTISTVFKHSSPTLNSSCQPCLFIISVRAFLFFTEFCGLVILH